MLKTIPLPYLEKPQRNEAIAIDAQQGNKRLFESFCLLTHPLKTHLKRTQLVHIFMHENFCKKNGNEIRCRIIGILVPFVMDEKLNG